MGADAKVRVRLDTSEAKDELQALYDDFENAPAISPGGRAGAGGASVGGGVGLGGLAALGGSIAALGVGPMRGTFGTAGTAFGSSVSAASSHLEQAVFGKTNARQMGARDALEQLKQQAGLAVGYKLADPEDFSGIFAVMKTRAMKERQGQVDIENAYNTGISDRAINDFVDSLEKLGDRIVTAIKNWNPFG